MRRKLSLLKKLKRQSQILIDKLQGLDFLTMVEPEEVGLNPQTAYRSSPSGDKFLKHLLDDFKITLHDAIIDIGCGKGSAMRVMQKFPFDKVDGLELSSHIAEIAKRNFKKLKNEKSRIIVGDAREFQQYDAYNIIYLYNPFPCAIMSEVVHLLEASAKRLDRELIIIYNNAICHEAVIKNGVFQKHGIYPDIRGNLLSIYSNRDFNQSRLFHCKELQRH
ncbi:MAG: class I SAM-dependent methyltransferase [Flavobacteriales bacterium]|nr:class I SAM-dependent methyltransferase [Flavobacteriales bacterium]